MIGYKFISEIKTFCDVMVQVFIFVLLNYFFRVEWTSVLGSLLSSTSAHSYRHQQQILWPCHCWGHWAQCHHHGNGILHDAPGKYWIQMHGFQEGFQRNFWLPVWDEWLSNCCIKVWRQHCELLVKALSFRQKLLFSWKCHSLMHSYKLIITSKPNFIPQCKVAIY